MEVAAVTSERDEVRHRDAADLLPPAPCGRGSAWRTPTLRLCYLTSAFMNLPLHVAHPQAIMKLTFSHGYAASRWRSSGPRCFRPAAGLPTTNTCTSERSGGA